MNALAASLPKPSLPIATAILAAGLALSMACGAAAETYPSRPIKMISPFSAGSPPDAFGRLVAQQLSKRIGQSVVIENRPGAGTTIATKVGALSDPDGYTLLQVNASLAYTPVLYPNSGYDPVKSFTPVALLAAWTHVLVAHPSVEAKTLRDLIAYAKAHPGKLNIGFPLGAPPHVLAAKFKMETGADINSVPYRQAPLLVTDVAAGRVQLYFSAGEPIFSMIRRNQLKAYAFTGATRDPGFPDVPTMAEAGLPNMTVDPSDWTGIVTPAGTAPGVVAKLNAAINEVLESAEIRGSLAKLGWSSKIVTPRESAAFIAAATEKWSAIVKAAGLKVQ